MTNTIKLYETEAEWNADQQRREQLRRSVASDWAVLSPTGNVQVIVPPNERAAIEARYTANRAALVEVEQRIAHHTHTVGQQANQMKQDVIAAFPQLLTMMAPNHPLRPQIERMVKMSDQKEQLRALKQIVSDMATPESLSAMGPMGAMVRPFLNRMMAQVDKL